MNPTQKIYLTSIIFILFTSSVYAEQLSYREQLEALSSSYIKTHDQLSLQELIQKRTNLNIELGQTYNKIFATDPTMRIKMTNYLRILNKSLDTVNRLDVNAPLITRADQQFEEEFLPIALKIDPDFTEKLALGVALDYLSFQKMFTVQSRPLNN